MKHKISALLLSGALCVSLIAPALALTGDTPPTEFDTTTDSNGQTQIIPKPDQPEVSPPPSGGGGGGGGSYVPPTVPSVTIEKESSGKGTFNVSVGTDKITIVTSPTQGNVVDTITVTDANGNVLTLTKTSENHYECDRPANGGKLTVSVAFKAENYVAPVNPFVDVRPGAYFYNAVLWAVEKGITTGTSATTFSPYETCTRAQTVTFLWRAAGSPAPASSENPFTDVNAGEYYHNAVLWAVEQGITNGTSATTFSPNATVTRGQTVTFLFRAAKAQAAEGSNPFVDVAAGEYYADAVQWAVAQNITNGTSATTFGPSEGCTRGQIVTFLYRAN